MDGGRTDGRPKRNEKKRNEAADERTVGQRTVGRTIDGRTADGRAGGRNETKRSDTFHGCADQAPTQTKFSRTAARQESDAAGPAKRVRRRFRRGRSAPLVPAFVLGGDFWTMLPFAKCTVLRRWSRNSMGPQP